nr:unnamed protein product [Callosobruchus analis]
MRVRIDMEEDFKIIERTVRRYHFNLLDEQVEDLDNTWVEGGNEIRYMRERIDMEEDFKILERVGRRYHFNLLDERVEGGKRRLYHQPPTLLVDDTDDDDDDTGGYVNEVNVGRLSRHQVKRNKGEASIYSSSSSAGRLLF